MKRFRCFLYIGIISIFIFQITLNAQSKEYKINCLSEDINYYICGEKHKSAITPQEGILYYPVTKAVFTTFFHRYPDVDLPHRGVDIIGDKTILPALNGRVVEACFVFCGAYGKYIIIEHEELNIFTLYAHLDSVYVKVNEVVQRNDIFTGTPLGFMGNTGASLGVHLHFEVRSSQSHEYQYRLDPLRYFKVHINECSNMFGLVDALYSSVHQYQQWYGLDESGNIYVK